MRKIKDTDYLYISTRLKVLEKNMLSSDKYIRMISAKSTEDALKVLIENGWKGISDNVAFSIDDIISKRRKDVLDLLYTYAPDRRIIDFFRIKFDYHNIKVFVKSQALGVSGEDAYSEAGTVPSKVLKNALRDKNENVLPKNMFDAAVEAEDVLARTGDPQLSDIIVDNAQTKHMQEIAAETKSEFLKGYSDLYTDLCNLRVVIRGSASGKDRNYRMRAFSSGGSIDITPLINDDSPENIEKVFLRTPCAAAATTGLNAINGESPMSDFDMACDRAVMDYINKAKLIPFGEAQIVSYLIKSENEQTSVRLILTCRALGMKDEQIMERLRRNDA